MSTELPQEPFPRSLFLDEDPEPVASGMSSLYKLFEAFIAMREKNERMHRLFEQNQNRARDTLIEKYSNTVADTQRAFQSLRQELTGEKRVATQILNEIVDICFDLEHIVAGKPESANSPEIPEDAQRWMQGIEIQCRKVQDALRRHGVHPYDAVIASPYRPELHERVGSKRMEGMDANLIAEQKEHGFASQHPEFVLRRPKVIVSE